MSNTSTQSFADVGAINKSSVKDGDASYIEYLNVDTGSHYFWTLSKVEAIKIGDSETTPYGYTSEYNFEGYEYPAIIDTGTSFIYMP